MLIFSPNIHGKLVSYSKSDENNGHTTYATPESFLHEGLINFMMSEENIRDILEYPEKYTAYWVKVKIWSMSLCQINNVHMVSLAQHYDDLWVDSTSLYEGSLSLNPFEMMDSNVLIIVKTENMTVKQIDSLIKSIKITIQSSIIPDELASDWLTKYNTISF